MLCHIPNWALLFCCSELEQAHFKLFSQFPKESVFCFTSSLNVDVWCGFRKQNIYITYHIPLMHDVRFLFWCHGCHTPVSSRFVNAYKRSSLLAAPTCIGYVTMPGDLAFGSSETCLSGECWWLILCPVMNFDSLIKLVVIDRVAKSVLNFTTVLFKNNLYYLRRVLISDKQH